MASAWVVRGRHARGRLGAPWRPCRLGARHAGRGDLPGRVLGRKAADDRHHQERRHHERATSEDQRAAAPEPALARGTSPPDLTAHS